MAFRYWKTDIVDLEKYIRLQPVPSILESCPSLHLCRTLVPTIHQDQNPQKLSKTMASSPQIPLAKLQDGTQIPIVSCIRQVVADTKDSALIFDGKLGFGTGTSWYKPDRFSAFNPEMVTMAKDAINAGYRHLDTAEGYGTEAELGQAIKESNVPREELFVATKVVQTITEGKIEDLPTALENSLKRLQLDYVDL